MMLSNIVRRNIKRNFKDYLLYFISMIFSMIIYFTFASLQYNTQMKKAMANADMINGAFLGSKIMLIIFIGVFIIYSNNFFIRKRKKEVGLYSLLGIHKKQIGKMLFWETMLVGSISLVIGIAIGSMCSKLFLQLLVSLMKLNVVVHFEISRQAILDTICVFFIILMYTSYKSFRLIYRFKLIELFHAERKGEAEPKGSIWMACMGFLFIGSGYTLVILFEKTIKYVESPLNTAIYILLSTVGGTYLLFMSYTVLILKHARRNKNRFYNGMNIINISQLLYQVKGNAKLLATISVLSAVTLTATGTSSIMYTEMQNIKESAPYSFSYEQTDITRVKETDIQQIFNKNQKKHPVTYQANMEIIPVKEDGKGTNEYQLLSQSTFNTIAKDLNLKSIHLQTTEAYIYNPYYDEKTNGNNFRFKIGSEQKELMIQGSEERYITDLGESIVIVPDQMYEQAKQVIKPRIVTNINVKNEKESKELTAQLMNVISAPEKNAEKTFDSFYNHYEMFSGLQGIMMFIGSFLGLVFLCATGSIIYFKQLSEAYASHKYYTILRKLGLTNKELKTSIFKQVRFSFLIPVIVGIVHSFFALKLIVLGKPMQDMLVPILISSSLYCLIYCGYYLLTVQSYFKIVSQK
ncbi:ABC transporter permease [Peribacillus butanolivorans]|uniref:ABC transporter permease n=1 Tax=Peribacillus butanolivorans TaxID=421767 RepID=UPI003687C443